MHVLVNQSCSILCNPMDCTPPGSSIHGILHARILEWVAIPFSRGSSWPRNWTLVSCIASGFFTVWDTREAIINFTFYHNKSQIYINIFIYIVLSVCVYKHIHTHTHTHTHTHIYIYIFTVLILWRILLHVIINKAKPRECRTLSEP